MISESWLKRQDAPAPVASRFAGLWAVDQPE